MFSMFIWIKDWCVFALECELESLVYSEQTDYLCIDSFLEKMLL